MSKLLGSKPTHASAMKLFTKAKDELEAAQAHNQAEKADLTEKLNAVNQEEAAINKSLSFFNNLFGTSTASQEAQTDA